MKNNKFKPGDKVFYIIPHNEINGRSFMEISIEIIDQVCVDRDGVVTYWVPSWDEEVLEEQLLPYGDNIFQYLEEYLIVNDNV